MEVVFFLIGTIFGSFLTLCAYRIPREQSIVFPASHCLLCKTKLAVKDLVPVLSYLLIKGRCRYCHGRLPTRYLFIELVSGCIFLWCYRVLGLSFELISALIFSSYLIVITVIDYDHQLILDKILVWLAGFGAAIQLWLRDIPVGEMALASAVGGGILLAIVIVSNGGMGWGDVKFAAVLGLWLGVPYTVLVLLLAFIIGGISGMLLIAFKVKSGKDVIPFGPCLAVGAFIAMLYGNRLITWYLEKF